MRLLYVILISLVLLSCDNKITFILPNNNDFIPVLKTIVSSENNNRGAVVFYDKFLIYDLEREYPIECWKKDSFGIGLNLEEYYKPTNPFYLPNKLSVSYLTFLIESLMKIKLTENDTLYFRAQIDSNIKIAKAIPQIDSFSRIDSSEAKKYKSRDLRNGVCFFSVPIFNLKKDIVFIRFFYRHKFGGGGDWMLLQKKNKSWTFFSHGSYLNIN